MEKIIGQGEVKVSRNLKSLNMDVNSDMIQIYFEDIASVEGVQIGVATSGSKTLKLSDVKKIPNAQDLLARIDVLISKDM